MLKNSGYAPNQVNVYFFKAMLETLRNDAAAALRTSETLVELSQERGFGMFLALGLLSSSWARARLGDWGTGLMMEFRRALAAYTDQGNKGYVPFYRGLLAEIEAETEGAEGALARIDSALALAQESGEHFTDAFLHRVRGEILLRNDRMNKAPAEEAFLTAIAGARQQKAKSFELRAALSLAKLYQSTNRAVDAHSVLAPALDGFSPTPEFPEIEEAQSSWPRWYNGASPPRGDFGYWPITSFTALQKGGRYRINSGQTAPSGLTSSAAFDP